MPQSLVQIYVHIVFSTKERDPFLRDKDIREKMHAYLVGAFKNLGSPSLVVGAPEDHIHGLCRLSKTLAVADLIRDAKRESSKWVKAKWPDLVGFHWQNGYGAFSISPSHVDDLTRYIRSQQAHHREETYQEESRRLCRKCGVELDERYAWD